MSAAILLALMLLKVVFFLYLSSRHHKITKKTYPTMLIRQPLVSVVIPCFNEEITISNCVKSLMNQNYTNFEIILVDDGSTDRTHKLITQIANNIKKVKAYSKINGGKASALNFGITKASGEIVVCMDADSMFLRSTVTQLVLSFQQPNVCAVGGNVRVANRGKTLGKHQALEYITGLTIQRRAFAQLDCMQVISGAVGAFRRSDLIEVGCYSTDTIVEDMDITIEFARRGKKIVYNPYAVAYTEAPESIGDFFKQRYRWTYGGFQIASKHKDILFRNNSKIANIGLPYFIIFPWVDVLVSLMLFITLGRVIIYGGYVNLIFFYLTMVCLQSILILYALIIDKEDKKLIVLASIESLFYSHLINLVTLKSGFDFLRKKETGWNSIKRHGKNSLVRTHL